MIENQKKNLSAVLHTSSLSFLVQICKMMISSGVFFNFKILIFWVVSKLKWQKMAQNDKKFLSVAPYISGTIYQMIFIIVIYGTHVCIKV